MNESSTTKASRPRFVGAAALVIAAVLALGTAAVFTFGSREPESAGSTETAAVESLTDANAGDQHDHDTQPAPQTHASRGHGPRDVAGVWSAASASERAAANELIETTQAATAQYQDVAAALADGFRPNPNQHGRIVHYPNARNRRDDNVLDPNHLEGLVYRRDLDGRMHLVGALYIAYGAENPPAPGGSITMWHSHTPGCEHPAETPECEGSVRMYMLHVWLADGVTDPFADTMRAAR